MEGNEKRIEKTMEIMSEIDRIMEIVDMKKRNRDLKTLKGRAYEYSVSTVCEKRELEFSLFLKNSTGGK